MQPLERRYANLAGVKLAVDGAQMSFTGYASVFGNVDSYGDVVEPGAFAASLASWQARGFLPPMLLNHDPYELPIGVWTSIEEDSFGLKVSGMLAATDDGKDVYTLLKMQPQPAISGMSIGYQVTGFQPGDTNSGVARRLTALDLWEISLVTFPANDLARVDAVKSLAEMSERELERRLIRDGRLPKRDAMTLISALKSRGWPGRDDGPQKGVADALRRNISAMTGR